jgi:hypothetical protein
MYYVYDSRAGGRARVHKGECNFCIMAGAVMMGLRGRGAAGMARLSARRRSARQ